LSSTVPTGASTIRGSKAIYLKRKKSMVDAKNLPKLGVFVFRGGYGNPGIEIWPEE